MRNLDSFKDEKNRVPIYEQELHSHVFEQMISVMDLHDLPVHPGQRYGGTIAAFLHAFLIYICQMEASHILKRDLLLSLSNVDTNMKQIRKLTTEPKSVTVPGCFWQSLRRSACFPATPAALPHIQKSRGGR